MNVSVGSEFERFVDGKVASGDYGTATEVVRAALRLLKEQDAEREAKLHALRLDVRQGLEQLEQLEQLERGEAVSGRKVFAQLRGRHKAAKRK
jgi:antitoxin ParD1/3/4